MQLRSGRYGPYYVSTHDCGETRAYAPRVGVDCPVCGGDIVEKRSKKGKVFYGCKNWPACEWVSWNRPIQEPCAECGGIQVDMGRGRLRCLKHEGEPPRFVKKGEAEGEEAKTKASASTRRNGTAVRATTTSRTKKAATTTTTTTRRRTAATSTTAARKPAASRRSA
jgi:DNA topoisomerase-1